jgi:hypothetical protein
LSETNEPWPSLTKDSESLETLAGLNTELSLKDSTSRHADERASLTSGEKISFRLESDVVGKIVSDSTSEARFRSTSHAGSDTDGSRNKSTANYLAWPLQRERRELHSDFELRQRLLCPYCVTQEQHEDDGAGPPEMRFS